MLTEIKIQELIHKRLQDSSQKHEQYFRMMNAVMRLPLMFDQFQKAQKRKESAEVLRRMELESINLLRHHDVTEANQEQFFDKFVTNIDKMTQKKKRHDSSPRKNENTDKASTEGLSLRKYQSMPVESENEFQIKIAYYEQESKKIEEELMSHSKALEQITCKRDQSDISFSDKLKVSNQLISKRIDTTLSNESRKKVSVRKTLANRVSG